MSAAARWLLLPLHALALASGAKNFRANPLLGSRRLNRMGLHVARMKLAERMADWRRHRMAGSIDPDDRAAFARDGFLVKHDFLPTELFQRAAAEATAHRASAQEMRQGCAVTRRVPLDQVDRGVLPACRAAVEQPGFDQLVKYVASHNRSPFYYVQAIVADPAEQAHDPQTDLHADTFHPICKAWLFLQDVGEDDGPFQYVPGSHRLTDGRAAWEKAQSIAAAEAGNRYHAKGSFRVTPEDLAQMGLPLPRRFAVPANTLVVADTHGFHGRTPSPRPTLRIELYATLRRSPFAVGLTPDLLSAPWLRDRPSHLLEHAQNMAARLGLRGNSWPRMSPRRMSDPRTGP